MSDETNDEISRESVYREMYNEARRHRDHEFTSSTWFVTLLLGILGFLLTARFGNANSPNNWDGFTKNCPLRIGVIGLCFCIALAATLLAAACHQRYAEIRGWLNSQEPKYKRETFSPKCHIVAPQLVYIVTPWLVFVTIVLVVIT